MTKKYERQCWSCGSKDMERDDRGVHCQSYGATWNDLPEPSRSPFTTERDDFLSVPGELRVEKSRPSVTVQRRATAARARAPQ